MKKILLLFATAPLLMATTCEDDDHYRHHPCTAEARAGLNVDVLLNGDQNVSAQGITVTAREGNYIEDLMPTIPDTPSFSGAYERPGTYVVTVAKEGYHTFVSNPVVVDHDDCHVIPQTLTVDLQPAP